MKRLLHILPVAALALGLTVAVAYAMPQGPTNTPRLYKLGASRVNPMFGSTLLFSLALTSACACDGVVTDSVGRSLIYDGGSAYCTKHNEWSGIAVGDMVLCPAGAPRIMPGGDGGGDLGIQMWGERINGIKRSQEFEHADWSEQHNVVAAPARTANACLAPDGTMTADLVHFPAVTASALEYSLLYQGNCQTAYNVRTIYARAALADAGTWADDGGTLTGSFLTYDGTAAIAGTCNTTSASYTRCRQFDTDAGQVGIYFQFGTNGSAGARAEQYVCVWQADCQPNTAIAPNPWPPPIKTVATTVTRAGDVGWFEPVLMPQWTNWVMSAQFVDENGQTANTTATLMDLALGSAVGNRRIHKVATAAQCEAFQAVTSKIAASTTVPVDNDTLTCSYDGDSTITSCVNGGGCGDMGVTPPLGTTSRVMLGSMWNGFDFINPANGVVKNARVTELARRDIYLFGDSIVEGNTAGAGHQPQYIIHNALGNAVSVQNLGVSGYSISDCQTAWDAQLNKVIDAGYQSRSFFMLQCGINGVTVDGGTLFPLQAMLARAADAGVHTLGSTITPFLTQATEIRTVNAQLRAWGASNGITIAETYNALESPPDSGQLNVAYDTGDHEHPNSAGVSVETNIWIQAGGWQ